eukprot:304094-Chlamydomonas_euryale.AAC.1
MLLAAGSDPPRATWVSRWGGRAALGRSVVVPAGSSLLQPSNPSQAVRRLPARRATSRGVAVLQTARAAASTLAGVAASIAQLAVPLRLPLWFGQNIYSRDKVPFAFLAF